MHVLRGVKDWVHRKTAKIIHDLNSFCNLDMIQKLVSVMIIKISYLCTLHNKIISPAHLCCLHVVAVNAHLLQHKRRFYPEFLPGMYDGVLIVVVSYSVGTRSATVGILVRLVQR